IDVLLSVTSAANTETPRIQPSHLIVLPFNLGFILSESHRFGPSTAEKSNTAFTWVVCGSKFSAKADTQPQLVSTPMTCHSVGCGMPGRMASRTQSDTPNTAADHISLARRECGTLDAEGQCKLCRPSIRHSNE